MMRVRRVQFVLVRMNYDDHCSVDGGCDCWYDDGDEGEVGRGVLPAYYHDVAAVVHTVELLLSMVT